MAKTKRNSGRRVPGEWRARLDAWGGPTVVGGIALVVLLVVGLIGWAELGGGPGAREEIPIGEQVDAFELPNVVSGEPYAIERALGERPVVVVSYMGFF